MKNGNCNIFLGSSGGKTSYLLCDNVFAMVKKFNAQLHYVLHEGNKYVKLEGESWKIELQKLKDGKQNQRQIFHSVLQQWNETTEARY